MGRITNPLKKIFTPTQRSTQQSTRSSSASSQQRTGDRAATLGETRAKRRSTKLFGWFKALFTRKPIESRTVTGNVGRALTSIKYLSPAMQANQTETIDRSREFTPMSAPQQKSLLQGAALQSIQQPTHSVLETAENGMPRGQQMLSQLEPMVSQALCSKGLNVTADYIQDFSSNNISFTNSEGILEPADLEWGKTASYSDHLTKFCGGDTDQVRRLSAVLTQKTFDIVSSAITGKEDCQWLNRSFDVSRIEEDEIKVEIKGTLLDQTSKRTKVENVTIAVPPKSAELPLAIETVAFLEPQE